MIEPTKHEDLKQNLLVIGGEILKTIRKDSLNVEDIYQEVKSELKESSLEIFYDAITLLWLLDFIKVNQGLIQLNKLDDVSEKTLF